jgi:hypothetical protein
MRLRREDRQTAGGSIHADEAQLTLGAQQHKRAFVILENVPIGVCDKCGTRYYHANLLHRVAQVAAGKVAAKSEPVPVAQFA